MQYEDLQKELHEVQKEVDALEGMAFSLSIFVRTLREHVARIELGIQRTIDTQDDLK